MGKEFLRIRLVIDHVNSIRANKVVLIQCFVQNLARLICITELYLTMKGSSKDSFNIFLSNKFYNLSSTLQFYEITVIL